MAASGPNGGINGTIKRNEEAVSICTGLVATSVPSHSVGPKRSGLRGNRR